MDSGLSANKVLMNFVPRSADSSCQQPDRPDCVRRSIGGYHGRSQRFEFDHTAADILDLLRNRGEKGTGKSTFIDCPESADKFSVLQD